MRDVLIPFLKHQLGYKTVPKLAEDIGIVYETLWRILEGQSKGNILTWEKIQVYYNKETSKAKRRLTTTKK